MHTSIVRCADTGLRFLRWWWSELAVLVPAAMKSRQTVLVLGGEGSHLVLHEYANERRGELVRVAGAGAPARLADANLRYNRNALIDAIRAAHRNKTRVLIALPRQQVLCLQLTLPWAAAENLRQVIEFEMPRLTPFEAGHVHFEYEFLEPARRDRPLRLRLWVVQRIVIDEMLATLAPLQLRVDGVATLAIDHDDLLLNLTDARPHSKKAVFLARAAWVVNAALFVAVLGAPLAWHESRLVRLRHLVAEAKLEAQAADRIRQDANALQATRRFLIERKERTASTVAVLAELSSSLPDTTWLRLLQVKSGQVRIQGASTASSSSLVELIEGSNLFHQATFPSPITRHTTTGEEQFQLAFEVEVSREADEDTTEPTLQEGLGTVAVDSRGYRRF